LTRDKYKQIGMTFFALKSFTCWYVSLFDEIMKITLIAIEAVSVTAIYVPIKLHVTLHVLCVVVGLAVHASVVLVLLHFILCKANLIKYESEKFLSTSRSLHCRVVQKHHLHLALRPIRLFFFNIPVHKGMFITILFDIIIAILINLLLLT